MDKFLTYLNQKYFCVTKSMVLAFDSHLMMYQQYLNYSMILHYMEKTQHVLVEELCLQPPKIYKYIQ